MKDCFEKRALEKGRPKLRMGRQRYHEISPCAAIL